VGLRSVESDGHLARAFEASMRTAYCSWMDPDRVVDNSVFFVGRIERASRHVEKLVELSDGWGQAMFG